MNKILKNIKQFIVKHSELFFLIAFCVIIFGITIYIETNAEDELWNFQNIYKMYNGYKIYIDANVITTPLFHTIGFIIFKIFGASFFVFRLYGIVINILLFVGVYKIFKSLKISKLLSAFLTMLILIAGIKVCHNTTNYNNLCLMFATYGILIVINRDKLSDFKFIILESLITFLIIITKQNIGLLYFISIVIYNLLFEKNKKIKNILKIIGINSVLITIFLIIMYKIGILDGFISYAVLGIKEFASKNVAVEPIIIRLIGVTIITSVVLILFNYKKLVDEDKIKNINSIACFAFPFLAISYPIFNVAHIDLSLIFIYIILIYMIFLIFDSIGFNRKIMYKITISVAIILLVISVIRIFLYFSKTDYSDKYDSIYFGAIMDNEINEKIEDIIDYINKSEEEVIIFSTEAAFYMMPLKASNGSLDEPLLGNFGKDGEQGIVKQISEMSNTKIMINKEKKVYQESDMVIQYIKDNLIYVGEIYDFLIYRTKK